MSLLFVFILLFQTIASSIAVPVLKAEGSEPSIFTNVDIIDEDGELLDAKDLEVEVDSKVQVHIDWSVSSIEVEAGSTYAVSLTEPLEIVDQQEGLLTVDDEDEIIEVGVYKADTDGVLIATLTDAIVDYPESQEIGRASCREREKR